MPLIETHNLAPGRVPYQAQVYNALDCAVTHEVHGELARLSAGDPNVALIYAFERALQAPALEMMLRGFKIDEYERQRGIARLRGEEAQLRATLDMLANAAWGRELNPRSPKVLKDFFYGAMKLPESWSSHKGVRKLSMNRETLEKLEAYFYARPFIGLILAIREVAKKLEVLTTEVGLDGRMRTSYNIAGTETGRWSSSTAADGSGTNLQNITPELRRIFVADPGWKLCNIDLEQTESFDVGWLQGTLFDDWTYLDACERGDLHTQVARLVWPDRAWMGDLIRDRKLADEAFYRSFSYRDMAKRGGHATNYLTTPFTMSRHLKIPIKLAEDFQAKYAYGQGCAFPAFAKWWQWTAQELQTKQELVTPLGRKRHFFGRPNDDATLREAIAFVPQSTTADRMNLGLWRMWKRLGASRIQLLGQVHDSVIFEFREGDEGVVAEALELTKVPLTYAGRTMTVGAEAKVGWNWGAYDQRANPDGLVKWSATKPDLRERTKVRTL